MNAPSTVLIIDRSAESRDVLRTLLERHGARAVEAGEATEAIRAAKADPPDLSVVDLDSHARQRSAVYRRLGEAAGRTNSPILVIGSAQRPHRSLPGSRFIAKPYHYRDLLRKIDQLLGNVA